MKVAIEKSQKLQQMRVITASIIAFLLVVLCFWILGLARDNLPFNAPITGLILHILVVGVAIGAVFATWAQDQFKTYELDDDKLIITSHFYGTSAGKQIITLNSKTVSKLHLRQSTIGKFYNYGNITIEIDRYSKKERHVLEGIDQPDQVIAELDSHLYKARKA